MAGDVTVTLDRFQYGFDRDSRRTRRQRVETQPSNLTIDTK